MKIISHSMIQDLHLNPHLWYIWAEHVLKFKHEYIMPAKLSIHYDSSYFNTMPSILPAEGYMGVKVVNRYLERVPALESQLLLYDYKTGENLALMDASLITAMRTGAAAVHAMNMYAVEDFKEVGMMGFGNIGTAFLDVLLEHYSNRKFKLKLLRYKDQADKVIEKYKSCSNIEFIIVDTIEDIIRNSDVIVSSITFTNDILGKDEWFKEGCVVLALHLRGFQNCDLFFDKVYGDDRGQVCGFKYFDKFKYFAETSEVLRGEKVGRENNKERILVYYVGLSLHDIYAASKIYEHFSNVHNIEDLGPSTKMWL